MSSPARIRRSRGAITSARLSTGRSSPTMRAATASTSRARADDFCACVSTAYRWTSPVDISTCAIRRAAITGQSSWQPVGKPLDEYQSTCRHGTAYTVIESHYAGIATETTYFVPLGQTFEYWRLKVTNESDQPRKLSLFSFCEFTNQWDTFQDSVNLQYSLFIVRGELTGDNLLRIAIQDNLTPETEGCLHPRYRAPQLDGAGRFAARRLRHQPRGFPRCLPRLPQSAGGGKGTMHQQQCLWRQCLRQPANQPEPSTRGKPGDFDRARDRRCALDRQKDDG